MKDMDKTFRKRIEDDEGDLSELLVTVGEIILEVADKYGKVSGITITSAGIDISGSKYLKLESGCELDIESGGKFNIKSGGEMEFKSGGSLKLVSGSTFDLDSANFKINSAGRYFTAGDWKFYDYGVDFNNHDFIVGPGSRMTGVPTGKYAKIGPMDGSDEHETGLSIAAHNDEYSLYLGSRVISLPSNTCFVLSPERVSSSDIYMIGESGSHWDEAYIDTVYQSSSRAVKHDIKPLNPAGEKIDRLWPVSFVYNKDKTETVHNGLIYEDTVDVLPEICKEENGEKSINYMELVPILLKEIQDLRKRVAMLEARNV